MNIKNAAFIIVYVTIMLLLFYPSNALAQENEKDVMVSGDYQYKYDSQTDSIEIVGYSGTKESVVVPACIDGKRVREISYFGDYFQGNNSEIYTEINQQDPVTKEIIISDGIETIGGFTPHGKLEKIYIPDSVIEVSESAFDNCNVLKEVRLSSKLKKIGSRAFASCYSLSSIDIPYGVTEIEESAFYECKALEKIIIPDSVTKLGANAFIYCNELEEVCLSKGLKVVSHGAFSNCGNLKKITIPYGVKKIEWGAFYQCRSLKKIEIPDSVTKIGAEAFAFCDKLAKVKFPKNLKVIARATFTGCNLKSIEIPKKVTRIETDAFGANPLTKITIPSKVNYIGFSAFSSCTKLKKIIFKGSEVTNINTNAFKNIHSKAVFDVPNKSIKKYKKLLKDSKSFKGRTLRVV